MGEQNKEKGNAIVPYERGLLHLMLIDTEFLKHCKTVMPYEVLQTSLYRDFCKTIFEYYQEFESAPLEHFEEYYFEKRNPSDEEKKLALRAIGLIRQTQPNKEYIKSKLSEYLQTQSLMQAMLSATEKLKGNSVSGCKETLRSAIKVEFFPTEAVGTSIFGYEPQPTSASIVCPTRIDALDAKFKGYRRSELFIWMAPTNTGKSWALIHGAVTALKAGAKVIYYTLEMSETSVLNRMSMAISGLRSYESREGERNITYFDGTTLDISGRKTLFTDKAGLRFAQSLCRRGGDLKVVPFTGGKCTVADIESHLYQYEMTMGAAPDIIFLDYADLLKSTRKFQRDMDEIDDVYLGLRAIAQEKDIAVITATQANRGSMDERRVDLKHIAKSLGKATIADTIISLNQTEPERKENYMRLFVAKMREGERGYEVEIKQSYEIGAFCLDSRMRT